MHTTSHALIKSTFGPALRRANASPPTFLAPSIIVLPQTHPFSSTPTSQGRKYKQKDGNPARGTSALRRTGPNRKQTLSVKLENLPKPVRDRKLRSAVQVDQDHGLWAFFNKNKEPLFTPAQLAAHGRAWTAQELRGKDWDDLWRLWWACAKERNQIKTFGQEQAAIGEIYGSYEAGQRKDEISRTQKAIKFVLTERWYTWENARWAAMEDDEVNLYADPDKGEPAYIPNTDGNVYAVAAKASREATLASGSSALPPPTEGVAARSEVRV